MNNTLGNIMHMGIFKDYWTNLRKEEKEALANSMETSVNYLSQVAHGHKKPGRQFLALLELRLGRSRQELFMEEANSRTGEPGSASGEPAEHARLAVIRGTLSRQRKIDRKLLDSATQWYREQLPHPATDDSAALIHACKEALMQKSGNSQQLCWVHAALGWDIYRLGRPVPKV